MIDVKQWRETVVDTVHEAAEQYGLDPYRLLDSVDFVQSLDPLVDLEGEALVLGVTEAVRAAEADVTAQQRREFARSGVAMPDGSYYIRNADDLDNAIRAVGRGSGDHDEIRRHIIKRAKALGLSDRIPDDWTASGASEADHPEEPDEPVEDEATEAVDRVPGRVLEAKGTDEQGGRVFHMRILKFGDSRNGRRYTAKVMQEAVAKYEGAKAYDHHRTPDELRTSTLSGLVGSFRSVEARTDGLYGDLHLLPSANQAAEALDASLLAQAANKPPLVGVSHDVMAHFQPINDKGRRLQEATQIVDVQSVDVVANPSAGGAAVRAVAGGTGTEEESEVSPTKADVLAAFKEATDEDLAAVGLARAPSKTTESTTPPVRAVESGDATRTTEGGVFDKTSALGRLVAKDKLQAAGLAAVSESFLGELPDRYTEADLDARITSMKTAQAHFERGGLVHPTVTAEVATESLDKKVKALDAFFAGDFQNGYRSFREAYLDFTGYRPAYLGEDLNRKILRESFAADYEYQGSRATESMTSSSWNLVLGDSVTRRLIADYNEPALMDWMKFVSSMPPVNDFRTQRIERLGGYGVLPAVNQAAPYQPLTSPTNEEITYALAKKGGTEDVTLEMIANDDVRSISKIPTRLALAAKRTIFDFVFEFIRPDTSTGPLGTAGNPNVYDSTALYASGHNNTTSTALSQTALSASRAKMRKQAGYGDTANILSAIPRTLVVPPTLEELAFQLCTSAVAIPSTPAGPSNTPNIHQGLDYTVVDYWDAQSTTGWIIAADPNSIPTIEIGFYQGQRDPQLFTQSDQTVGSMFNADKFTYKIRHIYSGAVLDFRGFQRGNS
jgi:hypothetical protein